ncbi:fibronectin type III domain-containing protein [Gordonia sp. MP11Mi]|uniref:Fibronectin type III domain-containing protein n=1 Tax=Gordonia sp. MP11Mi TaxID=3022769 RepID=A0AA97GVQ6_9ACTN
MTVRHSGAIPAHHESGARRRTWWIVAASAVVILLACLFGVRFAIGGVGAVDSPSGLTTSVDGEGVKAAWTGVSGADGYQLVRDDSVVVYDGDATTYVDSQASTGKHRYTVRAVSEDVVSAASTASEATVDSSWGTYTPFVAQFPELLPQSPDLSGWKGVECYWMLSGFKDEMGTAVDGSGNSLSRARIACDGEIALSVAWLDSKVATDAVFANASKRPGIEAVKWRFGTGYYDGSEHVMHLRPDNHENVWIGIGANDATKDRLLEFANDMPLE